MQKLKSLMKNSSFNLELFMQSYETDGHFEIRLIFIFVANNSHLNFKMHATTTLSDGFRKRRISILSLTQTQSDAWLVAKQV